MATRWWKMPTRVKWHTPQAVVEERVTEELESISFKLYSQTHVDRAHSMTSAHLRSLNAADEKNVSNFIWRCYRRIYYTCIVKRFFFSTTALKLCKQLHHLEAKRRVNQAGAGRRMHQFPPPSTYTYKRRKDQRVSYIIATMLQKYGLYSHHNKEHFVIDQGFESFQVNL